MASGENYPRIKLILDELHANPKYKAVAMELQKAFDNVLHKGGGVMDGPIAMNAVLDKKNNKGKAPTAVSGQGVAYFQLNGNNKMEFVVVFPSGNPQILATEV